VSTKAGQLSRAIIGQQLVWSLQLQHLPTTACFRCVQLQACGVAESLGHSSTSCLANCVVEERRWHAPCQYKIGSTRRTDSLHRIGTTLWCLHATRFLKGLAIVDDVAYFGVSPWAPRSARDDPRSNNQLAAFDLVNQRLLWRREVCICGSGAG
jgi:hypothetical protein